MSEISESVIDAAWDEATSLSNARVPIEMERLTREQPDLITFVLSVTDGMGPRISEFAGFATFVTWKIFRNETAGRLKRITPSAIQRKIEENEEALSGLDDPGEEIDEAMIRKITPQPMVFAAMLAALAAAEGDEEQPLTLGEDDKGELILILKTVIDTLDDARNAALGRAR